MLFFKSLNNFSKNIWIDKREKYQSLTQILNINNLELQQNSQISSILATNVFRSFALCVIPSVNWGSSPFCLAGCWRTQCLDKDRCCILKRVEDAFIFFCAGDIYLVFFLCFANLFRRAFLPEHFHFLGWSLFCTPNYSASSGRWYGAIFLCSKNTIWNVFGLGPKTKSDKILGGKLQTEECSHASSWTDGPDSTVLHIFTYF